MKKKTVRKIILAAGAVMAAAVIALRELYRYAFVRGGSQLINRVMALLGLGKGHEEAFYAERERLRGLAENAPQTRMTILSARGEKLAGFYYPREGSDGKHIAFIVHGFRSDHAETGGVFLEMYHRMGYDVFAPDNVAHGASEGRYVGYDVTESEDALLWLSHIRERFGDDVKIILHGLSLGAATVMCLSDRVGPEVRFIVEDSGYTEAQSLLRGNIGYPLLKEIYRQRSGVDLLETDVRPHLERASVPILFVHGTQDKLVPAENGPYLFEYYQGPKDCLFTEGARHIETAYRAEAAYEQKIREMAEKYIGE